MRRWIARIMIGAVLVGAWPAPDPSSASARATSTDSGVVTSLIAASSTSGTGQLSKLVYDQDGDGRVVEVVGDLATADKIAVIVPGVATTLQNFDRGQAGVQRRSPAWQAQQLYAAAGGQNVAVIAWLGYDPPDGVGLTAMRSDRAVAGAAAFVPFINGLAQYRPQAAITVIGHSYGSLVVAYSAAGLPSQVTDLVTLGSPGMDVGRAGKLPTHARLWSGSATGDWTWWLPDLRLLGIGHGTNPDRPWFGSRPLNVDGAHGHDGYFVSGTASLRSLAAITLGAPNRDQLALSS